LNLLPFLYFFALVQVWLGILSLRGGLLFRRYLRVEACRPKSEFAPFVSVIAPCRGSEEGLSENLGALLELDYPKYEIIFVVDDEDDPAAEVIHRLIRTSGDKDNLRARLVVAGMACDSGQKVHNLLVAIEQVDPASVALAFVDSDACPHREWLRDLVEPLAGEAGAATGYRWFVPQQGSLASHFRSVWNASIASSLGGHMGRNFCWGGSTAILRTTFDEAEVAKFWKGAASDDFAMMHALRAKALPIHFVPSCLVASHDSCSWSELLEFTTRQLKITRVYAPGYWKAVLTGALLFVPVFFGLTALAFERIATNQPALLPGVLTLMLMGLGAAKSWIRLNAVSRFGSVSLKGVAGNLAAHLLLWPFASVLFLVNSLSAALSRRIEWRGITYELKSPNETVIIRDQTDALRVAGD
jgi:cellulose synthase/poly-beta-1,6-N-acetylglucosamine synthase-like glycosyltransferase